MRRSWQGQQGERLEPRIVLANAFAEYEKVSPQWFTQLSSGALDAIGRVGPLPADADLSADKLDYDSSILRWIVRLDAHGTHQARTVRGVPDVLNDGQVSFAALYGLGLPGEVVVETVGHSKADVADALRANPHVAMFQRDDMILGPQAAPDDPDFDKLRGLDSGSSPTDPTDPDIDAPEAWNITTGSSDIVVAVIDTGIDYNHPDLAANVWTNPGEIPGDGIDNDNNGFIDDVHGYDFANSDSDPLDDHRHGTHVAGTIAAVGNNGIGVVGVNWQSSIMALKYLDRTNQGLTSNAKRAINYATMMRERDVNPANVRVINASWGGPGGFDAGMRDEIERAGEAGILFVAAAGNGDVLGRGVDNDLRSFYPASYGLDNIIAVAASDQNDELAPFSNFGKLSVDLAAPGVGILSTEPGGSTASRNGTSMATPHVSGVAALVWSHIPYATVAEVRSAILRGVDELDSLSNRVATGGRLNAFGALTVDTVSPRATLKQPRNITTTDVAVQEFEITILDNVAVDWFQLSTSELVVTSLETGESFIANATAVSSQEDLPELGATYQMDAPGGTWDALENATYEVALRSGQVFDTASPANSFRSAVLGTFEVDVPDVGQILVNTFDDTFDTDDSMISLREAVQKARDQNSANTILLPAGVYDLTLSGAGTEEVDTGDLDVFDELTIRGASDAETIIRGTHGDRIFDVHAGGKLTLQRVTLADANVDVEGAAVRSHGELVVANSTLTNNQATDGGAIYNAGTLTITGSTIVGNSASQDGGGVYNLSGTAHLSNSTFSANQATKRGGAIHAEQPLTLSSVTVALNSADEAGGGVSAVQEVSLRNTLIAQNTSVGGAKDISGQFQGVGGNLIGDGSGATGVADGVNNNQVGTSSSPIDSLLEALGSENERTETHKLLPGSPAINAGIHSGAPATDQRGIKRPRASEGGIDVGAFERFYVEIEGTKFHDANGNGLRDEGDVGLAGWEIFIDLNENGLLDDDEPRAVSQADDAATAGVDETGFYRITHFPPNPTTGISKRLPPDTYTVAEVRQANFRPTLPRELVFESLPQITNQDQPAAIAAGDFDRDGHVDLAIAKQGSSAIELLLNDGATGFPVVRTVLTNINASALVAVDFSSDGNLDLLATDTAAGQLVAMTNDGSGVFTAASISIGANPAGLVTGDFDGANGIDVAVTHDSGSVSLLFNDGNGVFTSGTTIAVTTAGLRGISGADIDDDGDVDLVVTIPAKGEVAILLNQGDGSFTVSEILNSGGSQPRDVVLADFDVDGDADIAVANFGSDRVSLMLNRGDGSFTATVPFPAGSQPTALVAQDFDNDFAIDLAVVNQDTGTISILLNTRDVTPTIGGLDHGGGLTFDVNSTADEIDTNVGNNVVDTASGNITLRAAIMEANAHDGDDVINLPAGTYTLSLPGADDTAVAGDLDITDNLTIVGSGANATIIDAASIDRVLEVLANATLTISGVTISGGSVSGRGGGIYNRVD